MFHLTGYDKIQSVGVEHPDRELFDCLMPLPHGTTYNSYLLHGQDKTALIDAVDPDKVDVLMDNLSAAAVERIDYLVCLHTEQDHAGGISRVKERWPDLRIVATARVRDLLGPHLHIAAEDIDVVAEGDVLDLGGLTLRFYPIPSAHWPDNTMVYCQEERILFSSDLFGSHFAMQEEGDPDPEQVMHAARSYFSEIMMPFRTQITRYVARVRELDPLVIVPGHGPVWTDPDRVLSAYESWTAGQVLRKATIPFVSMHGSTRLMVEHLAQALTKLGIEALPHDLGAHPASLMLETGQMIYDLVDSAVMILATPTVLVGPHPAAVYAGVTATAMKPPARLFGIIGSFGWGSKAAETMATLTAGLKAERLEPLLVKGLPTEADLARIDAYAADIAARLDAMEI